MKTKEKRELKTKTDEELRTILKDTENNLLSLRFQASQSKLKDKRSIFITRKKIARIMTLIRERKNYE